MNAGISQEQIGQRLAALRKFKGLSQSELAKNIEMSRTTITQIELGNRKLDVLELYKLSLALGFSTDYFLSGDFTPGKEYRTEPEDKRNEERIAVPTFHPGKFKNILLYILEHCAGKPNVGDAVLYKLFYFADFNYYELYEEHLTGSTYRKLPFGPVPQRMDTMINQMIDEDNLRRVKTDYHGHTQTRYLPLSKPDLTKLKASEKEVIDRVIEHFSDWSATAISDYSHKDMPWLATKDNQVINYELAFYREAPFSVRNYGEETNEI